MLKKWTRIALASFLVLMVGASVAFATTARVRSLGNTGDYISDDSAVNRWYSTLGSFANQVNAELGQYSGPGSLTDTRGLGWTQAVGDDGSWGTYRISLNENALDHPGFWIGNPFYQDHSPSDDGQLGDPTGGAYDDTPMNKWDLAGAWDLGENAALGVSITQSKWSFEDTATDEKDDNSWITLGAGFSWTNADNLVIDAALNFGSAGGSYDDGAGLTAEWDSKTAFDVLGRLFYDWKDDVTLVPVVEFTQSEYSLSVSPAPLLPPNGDKLTDFLVGVGLNMDVNEDNMLVFALEFMNRKYEYANPDTVGALNASTTWSYTPTVRLALESDITTWFTTRIAAVKYLGHVEEETNGGDKYKYTPGTPGVLLGVTPPSGFEWFLGCGFTVAEWTIDLELNHEVPFATGFWLTGYNYPTAEGPVARISAVYNY